MKGLTQKKIDKLTKRGLYPDEPTLYLNVSAAGTKSWIQRIVINGKRHDVGLGGYPVISIQDARQLAVANRRAVSMGENILKVKEEAKVPTFAEAAELVIALHLPSWKEGERRARAWRQCLRDYAFPVIGEKKVSEITSKDVHQIVSPLWTAKHETGSKVRQRIGVIMKWSMVQGHRMDNPVEALSAVLPKPDGLKKHYRMIPHGEVGAAIQKIRDSGAYPTTTLCFEFTVLCAVRPTEARLATWDEVNLKEKVWTVPASRMKMNKAFRVPLSGRAVTILAEAKQYREKSHDLIFPGAQGGALSDSTVSKLCRENGIDGVPHGIARACFRSWCADNNVAREVAESCLGHVVGGVEASYQRSDLFRQRAIIMDQWANYLTGAKPAKVINLR